jgi:hypothetical protein
MVKEPKLRDDGTKTRVVLTDGLVSPFTPRSIEVPYEAPKSIYEETQSSKGMSDAEFKKLSTW